MTKESDPNEDHNKIEVPEFIEDTQSEINLSLLHQQLLEDLSEENFNQIYNNLNKQFSESEGNLLKKASLVEQLVIRLQLDELSELNRAMHLGIVKVDSQIIMP